MGKFRPIRTTCWIKFLNFHHFYKVNNRVTGSHFLYKKKGAIRSIPVRENDKDVPAFHLSTGCRTIGCTMDELYSWVDKNC